MNIQVCFGFPGNNPVGTPYNSLWRHQAFSGWMLVLSCLPRVAFPGSRFFICIFCIHPHAKQHTHLSPFHKGSESFLWKLQPKSPSVYAEPNDLDAMQINSVLIWMLPEIGVGRHEWTICTGLFVQPLLRHHHPDVAVVTPQPFSPCKITPAPAAHFILTFGRKPSSWWVPWPVCLVTASAGILPFFLR